MGAKQKEQDVTKSERKKVFIYNTVNRAESFISFTIKTKVRPNGLQNEEEKEINIKEI